MNPIRTALAASILPLLAPCQAPTPTDAQLLARSLNQFGAGLCGKAAAPDDGLCLSPASVSLALLMTLCGARGETAAELQKTLAPEGFDQARLHKAGAELMAGLRAPGEGIELAIANDLWPQRGHPLRADFLEMLGGLYAADVRPLDFAGAAEAARKTINDHVATVTRDRIRELLAEGMVAADTRLVLTNALYLKAAWAHPFPESGTRDRSFHLLSGEQIEVPTMALRRKLHHAETDSVQILRLFYEGGGFALDLCLPRNDRPLAGAEAALRECGQGKWPAELEEVTVQVFLPRFRVEGTFELSKALREVGLRTMFCAGAKADFSGIDDGKGKLCVDRVVHRTFLEVGEKGTEAAAATAVRVRTGGRQAKPEAEFVADRPFAYALTDLRSGLVLFRGRVTDPRGGKT